MAEGKERLSDSEFELLIITAQKLERRIVSLETKIEQLHEKSNEVKRFMNYFEAINAYRDRLKNSIAMLGLNSLAKKREEQ